MSSSDSPTILFVDDSKMDREVVSALCAGLNYSIDLAGSGADALTLFKQKHYDLVMTDYKMEPMDGFEFVEKVLEIKPSAVCVLMTGYLDLRARSAVEGSGFFDVLSKPVNIRALSEVLRVALGRERGATGIMSPIALSNRMDQCLGLLGDSKEIGIVRRELKEKINLKEPILISGPIGTGKSYIARFIHEHGPFAKSHFVECHCNELDEEALMTQLLSREGEWGTLLNEARGGTLVLHYVEALPMEFQRLLANAFQEIAESMHVICLAYTCLDEELSKGTIDDNLYFEISLCQLIVPSLEERPQDVEAMARHIISKPKQYGISYEYGREEADLLVVELRRMELTRNIEGLLEHIRTVAATHAGG
ncbi:MULTISPECIES: sigma-54 dependent transcriptional regulator [unclassified Lentimonas]|uniref:sigma-54-dependent transcriptional regulator n=1 Tax=unclassified Lentimonas TaxID=2630993 RepID=UPI001320C9E6|nr:MULTISPECIES: response regulator [unclassified Lentimonas]CAA6678521.1 Unannotated [Lentimonas sp. CC4]CAA6685753.1 Unannotated [Lentimonas sp. CC6]CAA7076227.1 Unannotated [Lentimonas sp. CC4]CAA7168721.1 Unannotated [Lentimonas sp. CC21]CAA7183459.1 Unannotated [Lentimonas sp. CC8]